MVSLNLTPEHRAILLQHLSKGSTAYLAIKRAKQFFNHVAPGVFNFIAECELEDARAISAITADHFPDAKPGIDIAIGMAEVAARPKGRRNHRGHLFFTEKLSHAPLEPVPEPQPSKPEPFKLVAEGQYERPTPSRTGPRPAPSTRLATQKRGFKSCLKFLLLPSRNTVVAPTDLRSLL
jgi:hypothetical protein